MKKKSTVFKTAVMGLAAIATSLTIGMSTACSKKDNQTSDEDEKVTTKVDEQLIKNGNFEFYSDNDGLYPISSPDNWSGSTSSSNSMSGIINTEKSRWDYITDTSLPKTLEDNDDLSSSDENKKDYNGALTADMLYENPHEALASQATDEQKAKYIANPFTHEYKYNDNGDVINSKGETVKTYADEDGKLFTDEALKTPLETSVLMIHNYRSLTDYKGTHGSYSSSTTLTLEANTAAKISLWVKTDSLTFDGTKRERTPVEYERGAYIKVNTSVGGNDVDSFTLKNIITSKLNPKPTEGEWKDNGWVQYTVYVEASSFAATTINLTLGLGESDVYTVEGYAFFDDVTFTKYRDKSKMVDEEYTAKIGEDNVSYPLSPTAKTEFRADEVVYKTNNGDQIVDHRVPTNFADRHFLIDFAGTTQNDAIALDSTIKGGLTVEETNTGNYVCAKPDSENKPNNQLAELSNGVDKAYLPTKLNTIPLKNDILSATAITSEENWKFGITSDYSQLLTDALKSAATLPGANGNTTALVMLSARGAAYEAQIENDVFTLDKDECMLVSFWVKTSNMDGKTAATVKVVDTTDKDNSASFTVDSTDQPTVSITEGDKKYEDVYDGWTRCFVRVQNNTEDNGRTFKIIVNFGNTTIKGTTDSSYNAGWLAVANASYMRLDEDVYGYTSNLANTASMTFSESTENTTHNFDSESGGANVIKNDLATPSAYTGINGNSISVKPTGSPVSAYDKTNDNPYAGLLNKENMKNYVGKDWYTELQTITGDTTSTPEELWNKVFGIYSVQPLLIVNSARSIGEKPVARYNYGYYGNTATINATSYSAVSVRVKASAGAIANVYLVEDGDDSEHNVLTYSLPKYNFWYDDDGNILKGEPNEDASAAEKKQNIAYTLRNDGLYESEADGKLYANYLNLTKYYDIRFEHQSFYNEKGEKVNYDDLVQGETYYANAEKTAYAPHHLIAGGKGNNKVYEYREGVGSQASYYYMEKGVANKDKVVYAVDSSVAKMRYDNSAMANTPYQFTIDTTKNPEYADQWITATFYVHTGSESKNYRLELWSGERDKESSYSGSSSSYVIFDYSSITLDETSFNDGRKAYVNEIIEDYKASLKGQLDDNDGNIADYEKLADKEQTARSTRYNYKANYYTFSLFDSTAFIPFNGETADANQSGYSFNYSETSETLAYLSVEDQSNMKLSAFIDYSAVDKDIDIIGEPTVSDNDTDNETETDNGDSANVWLLMASIVLVVAILVAMLAIFIRDLVKKHGRKKTAGKNSYNFNKNKRYVKKYVKANGEAPEIAEGEVDESLLSDTPAQAEASDEQSAATEETTADGATTEQPENNDQAEGAESGAATTDEAPSTDSGESSEGESSEGGEDKPTDDGEKPDGENK